MAIVIKTPEDRKALQKAVGTPSKKAKRRWLFKGFQWPDEGMKPSDEDFEELAKANYKRLKQLLPTPMLQAREIPFGQEQWKYGTDDWNSATERATRDLDSVRKPHTKENISLARYLALGNILADEPTKEDAREMISERAPDPDKEWGSLGSDPLAKGRLDKAKRERIKKSLEEKR